MSIENSLTNILSISSSSLQLRMDVVDVLADIRPVARVIVRKGEEAAQCAEYLYEEKLAICVGGSFSTEINGLGFVDHCSNLSEGQSFVRLYVSKQRKLAELARESDERADDVSLGHALGYPDCCIHAVKQRGAVPKILESLDLYSCDGFYNPYAWPAANLLDASLIPHFPCSMNCLASQRIAKSRIGILRELNEANCQILVARLINYNSMIYPANKESYPWDPYIDPHPSPSISPLFDLRVSSDL